MIDKATQQKGTRSPRTTLRHRMLLPKIIESKGKSIHKALVDVGYSHTHARNPKQVITSKGFQALLHEKGLTHELVAESLASDIREKPRHRVQELQLAADILRMRGTQTAASDFTPVKIVVQQLNVMHTHTDSAPIPHAHTDTAPTVHTPND